MPSKNMLPKGKRRQSVKADYRIARDAANQAEEARQRTAEAELFGDVSEEPTLTSSLVSALPEKIAFSDPPTHTHTSLEQTGQLRNFHVAAGHANRRLDQYLTAMLTDVSRSRVQLLIDAGQVRVNGKPGKARYPVQPGDRIEVEGEPSPPPLKAAAEDIPLAILFEDEHLLAVNKPAGMAVHAGSGATDDARSYGTLVNALLHRFLGRLSTVGGPLRPGIVHRLDKDTSGVILIAKTDRAHLRLAEMFHDHSLTKRYVALVHRAVREQRGTIRLPIARDPVRRTRMTTRLGSSTITTASHGRPSLRHPEERDEEEDAPARRRHGAARDAITHYRVVERISTPTAEFTLLDVEIETGRTHQIRVHLQSLGHPVFGDTLYGAPDPLKVRGFEQRFDRNFLHAARLDLQHPITGKPLHLDAALPDDLQSVLDILRSSR